MTATCPFEPLTDHLLDRLRGIVGPEHVLTADAAEGPEAQARRDALEPYSHDEVPDPAYRHMPEAVVRPASAEEVSEVLALAHVERIPVTPRGGGTGLAGGAVPICGGVVLALERMDRILDFDRTNLMAVLEPGVVTGHINEAARDLGLFFAGYPMSLDECHIGGNVATNAGGGKAIKYGVTARYVTGLEVVTAGGERMEVGGRLLKDATGYNLIGLLCGSEGTLGVFTRIVLKLLPVPRAAVDLFALFHNASEAIAAVPRLMTETGIVPASCEFMERSAFVAACRFLGEPEPDERAEAMLLVTLDGADEADVHREAKAVATLCSQAGALDVAEAQDEAAAERYWTIRRNIGKAFNASAEFQGDEDLVVPVSEIPRLIETLRRLAEKHGVEMPAYGHAADGNIHVHILPPPDWTRERWDRTEPQLLAELYPEIREMGGRISAEHGIGLKRKEHMPQVVSPVYLAQLRAVKRALDPRGVLNPGKIFDV